MKKLLALILAMSMMALSLVACGDSGKADEEKDTLVGEWEATVSVADALDGDEFEEAAGDMAEYFDLSDLPDLVIVVTFEEDGTYTATIDEESAEKFVEGFVDLMLDVIPDYIDDMAAEAGITTDEFYEVMGMTEDEFIDAFVEEMDKDALVEEMLEDATERVYEEKGDKIYFSDDGEDEINEENYWEFELDGDELKITKVASEDEDEADLSEDMLPLTFERQ